ncbi:glycosyltransferase family 31 protein [Zopfia rhizophila CBS 207.26]|uniref:Glycosyltransferase family 31 protein n=1 Tax=Zopfia rhizophila CBS 207.26 TaxID=1314779 RepID=A0A6A6DX43_9PEZI|nr:glycosyltransferase family 31 protein [Zopfia rhizophila CBS 207.26]
MPGASISSGARYSLFYKIPCSIEKEAKDKLQITTPIHYRRIEIELSYFPNHADGTSSKTLDISLSDIQTLDLSGIDTKRCATSISLNVLTPTARLDASHIIFGVATTLGRLNSSLNTFAHWAKSTGARNLGLNWPLELQISTILRRYFTLVKQLYLHRTKKTQWAAFIDDGMFFLSMNALQKTLDKYNASKPQYMSNFGIMAYGGGGVFISMPLLEQLNVHFDQCNNNKDGGGNGRIANCIYDHTITKISWESGLHQNNTQDDASGFYEAGRPQPLSIHHWKDTYFLRRWKLKDGWFLINGFSIIKYSEERSADDFVMEETWLDGGKYKHTLGPLRKKDEGKLSYRLEIDIHRRKEVSRMCVIRDQKGDKVIEVVWRVQ